LISGGLDLDPAASFNRHNEVETDLRRLIGSISDLSGLSTDADLAATLATRAMANGMLMSAQYAGRVRSLATDVAARGAFTPELFTELSSNLASLSDSRRSLCRYPATDPG
jgi:hypothetical protein